MNASALNVLSESPGNINADYERSLRRGIVSEHPRHNWPFYAFVVLIPLQNIDTGYLPNLGGGLNFLNAMVLASFLMARSCGGRLVRGTAVNGWIIAYLLTCVASLLFGYTTVSDGAGHWSILKDQTIGISFVFLAQMSATDWPAIRRLLLLSLLPLPYIFRILLDQHQSVDAWHYEHALRVSGSFSLLGANELGAFLTTVLLLSLSLLIALRVGWGWRVLLLGTVLISATGVVLTYSRTAYVAVLLGIAVVALLHRARARLVIPGLLAFLLLPALLPHSAVQRFDSIGVEEGHRDESTELRLVYWDIAVDRFKKQPITGTGYHTFHHAEVNPYLKDTHNFYLRELTEKGLIGAVVLIGMLFSIGRLLWRLLRRSATGGWSYALSLGLLGAFTGLLCGNLSGDRFTHYPMIAHFWLYIGLALRAYALQRESTLTALRRQTAHA